jgi:hypothetical protein
MLVLTHTNLVAKLVFHLEMSALFDALELHAFECAINLVLVELCLKELSDAVKSLGLELLAGNNKLVTIVLVEQHIKPSERKGFQWLWHVASWQQGFGSLQHLLKSTRMRTRRVH